MDRDYETASPYEQEGPRVTRDLKRIREKRGTLGLVNNVEAQAAYEGMFNVNMTDAQIEPQDRINPMDGLRRVSHGST